jgi:uncharacterized membrane protein YoaK (UPF0700 family)
MDVFQTWDQRWTPLLFVCGILLFVCGIVIRSLSARRTFTWRIGHAALDLGVTLLAIAVILHFALPYVVTKAIEAFPGG